ncbi:hypothetical protein [Micromonospora echinofusca]|uniref:hypothetical protein n=1 Tax=Micromonospora echinofusca TaxID=47858 RepID=UPI0033C09DAD
MEDLVEEIVGEIYDETDRDVQAVVREADGSLLMPGGFPLHDLPDVGMDLDEDTLEAGDYTTVVVGLVLAHLGHFPKGAGRGGRGAGPERRGGGGDRPGHHPGASASHVGARRRARAKLLIRPTQPAGAAAPGSKLNRHPHGNTRQ